LGPASLESELESLLYVSSDENDNDQEYVWVCCKLAILKNHFRNTNNNNNKLKLNVDDAVFAEYAQMKMGELGKKKTTAVKRKVSIVFL
jgi:hypothetical protein